MSAAEGLVPSPQVAQFPGSWVRELGRGTSAATVDGHRDKRRKEPSREFVSVLLLLKDFRLGNTSSLKGPSGDPVIPR